MNQNDPHVAHKEPHMAHNEPHVARREPDEIFFYSVDRKKYGYIEND